MLRRKIKARTQRKENVKPHSVSSNQLAQVKQMEAETGTIWYVNLYRWMDPFCVRLLWVTWARKEILLFLLWGGIVPFISWNWFQFYILDSFCGICTLFKHRATNSLLLCPRKDLVKWIHCKVWKLYSWHPAEWKRQNYTSWKPGVPRRRSWHRS